MGKKGILFGVGVGPGDPGLMTIKAVRKIEAVSVVSFPGDYREKSTAYSIAAAAVPGLDQKTLLPVPMPMSGGQAQWDAAAEKGAEAICHYLGKGQDAAYLTLGDPCIYSTFFYLAREVEERGYGTEVISGVPSFCAAAARAKAPLVQREEELRIIPALYGKDSIEDVFSQKGNLVFMKSGKYAARLWDEAEKKGRETFFIENCGMEGERILKTPSPIPEQAGYFTILFSRERQDGKEGKENESSHY